jgi:hypothetical protein
VGSFHSENVQGPPLVPKEQVALGAPEDRTLDLDPVADPVLSRKLQEVVNAPGRNGIGIGRGRLIDENIGEIGYPDFETD